MTEVEFLTRELDRLNQEVSRLLGLPHRVLDGGHVVVREGYTWCEVFLPGASAVFHDGF